MPWAPFEPDSDRTQACGTPPDLPRVTTPRFSSMVRRKPVQLGPVKEPIPVFRTAISLTVLMSEVETTKVSPEELPTTSKSRGNAQVLALVPKPLEGRPNFPTSVMVAGSILCSVPQLVAPVTP